MTNKKVNGFREVGEPGRSTMIVHPFLNLFTYFGAVISGIIVFRMNKMTNLTYVNNVFLIYFSIDTVHGFLQGFFTINLYERYS